MEKKAALKYAEFPKLGAAYYPECWDEEQQIADVEYMKKAGITVVRIGEFAWQEQDVVGTLIYQMMKKIISVVLIVSNQVMVE